MSYKQYSQLTTIGGIETWANIIVERDDAGNPVPHPITFDKDVQPTQAELDSLYEQVTGEKPVSRDDLRFKAYQTEADPLFFKWQRGEATKEQWLAKVAEIKERYK